MAVMQSTSLGCITLSRVNTIDNIESVYDNNKNDGLTIHFSGGDYCDEVRDYDLTLNIKCD